MSAEYLSYAWQCERRHTCIISNLDMVESIVEPHCPIVSNGVICGSRLVTRLYPVSPLKDER
jgi:hypothetical protein